MLEDSFFANKKIGLIEKENEHIPKKTWCYWESGSGRWDQLIDHQWSKGRFVTQNQQIELMLSPYIYKKLDAATFHTFARQKIETAENITWIEDEVIEVVAEKPVRISGINRDYKASQVFDSRIDPDFYQDKRAKKIWQHFKGWEIETEEPAFDPEIFTMMDYRIKYQEATTFTYVLPTSPTKALIEFTFFTPFLVEDQVYDIYLKKYIESILQVTDYRIIQIEKGIIPMSDYSFHKHHQLNITKIGTAGGWVRPSSGYSFRNSQRYAQILINNLKNGLPPYKGIGQNRFRTYDRIFLDLLEMHNEMGEALFTSMYSKNSIQQMFRFLDEQSSLWEDIRIISTFEKWPFLKAAARQL
jgi:lycopene beta-cyclase